MYVLYFDEAVERLLSMKKMEWHDSVLSFVPKPQSKPPSCLGSMTDPLSLSQADKKDEEGDERFYDAETGLESVKSCNEEDPSTGVEKEEIVLEQPPQHTAVISKASACLNTCSEDVESTDVDEEEIVPNEPSEDTAVSNESSVVVADAVADCESTLNRSEDLQKAEVISHEITTLPLEKLKLLKKLIKKRRICKICKVKVDLECEELVLTGNEDDIMTMETAVYEALSSASERTVNISKELGRLIASPKGQQWFDENCERCSFIGICYVVDDFVTKLLAADDAMVDAMRKWLTDTLCSERRSLKPHHVSFLETQSWMDFVRKFTDARLVLITADISKTEILVEGTADLVNNAVKEIDDLLDRHCLVNKKLPLKHADFKTMSFHQSVILNEVQDLVMQQHR